MLRADELWPPWRPEWVVCNDDCLLAVDKPAGVAAHPSELPEISDVGARLTRFFGRRPAILHGLDREASGLMVLAWNKAAARALAAQLERGVERTHLVALTNRPRAIPCEVVADRNGRLLAHVGDLPDLRGRLARDGAPIAGDRDHGGAPAERLLWHVARVRIAHPHSARSVTLSAEAPPEFARWLEGRAIAPRAAVGAAAERRYALGRRQDTDSFRLMHGAGDGLPGVQIDRYGDFALCSLAVEIEPAAREAVLDAVAELGFAGVYLKLRPKRASALSDAARAELAPHAPVRGRPAPSPIVASELGVCYLARLDEGLSTGIFLDQRGARSWLRANAAGKRVLNLFAHHGAFSVAAASGGARQTLSVDASGAAVERARENMRHAGACERDHACVKADALAWLEKNASGGGFDIAVLDPPSYATAKTRAGRSRFSAERDYRRLCALAMRVVAPGGTLLACTNLRRMTPAAFRRELVRAAHLAERSIARLVAMPPPLDFPPPPGEPWHLKSEIVQLE